MVVPNYITMTDYFEILNLAYEWADSYDNKDWSRLKTILGPSTSLDFRALKGPFQEDLTPDQYAAIISDKKVIGDPRVKTQHLLAGSKWIGADDGSVQVDWQLRVAHVRFTTEEMTEAVNYGHGHGNNLLTYKKIDGIWKIVGFVVRVLWVEGDLFGTLNPSEEA